MCQRNLKNVSIDWRQNIAEPLRKTSTQSFKGLTSEKRIKMINYSDHNLGVGICVLKVANRFGEALCWHLQSRRQVLPKLQVARRL